MKFKERIEENRRRQRFAFMLHECPERVRAAISAADAALDEAQAALFHGAPVTVGLENQIKHALACLRGET